VPTVDSHKILTLDRSLDKLILNYGLHEVRDDNGNRCHPYYRLLRYARENRALTAPALDDKQVRLRLRAKGDLSVQAFVSDGEDNLLILRCRNPVKSHGPGLIVTFSARLLDRLGDLVAVTRVREWLPEILGHDITLDDLVAVEQVGAVDVKTDMLVGVAGEFDLTTDKQWVTRLRSSEWSEGARYGSTNRLGLRVYDKVEQIAADDMPRFLVRWGVPGLEHEPDGLVHNEEVSTVLRVEFQFARPWLREQGVSSYDDLVEATPGLVRDALDRVKLVTSTPSGRRSQTLAPLWKHLVTETEEEVKLQKQGWSDTDIALTVPDDDTNEYSPYIQPSRNERATRFCGKSYADDAPADTDRNTIAGINDNSRDSDWDEWNAIVAEAVASYNASICPRSSRPAKRREPKRIRLSNSDEFTLVDAEDYQRVMKFSRKWCRKEDDSGATYVAAWYRKSNGKGSMMFLHRLIMNAKDDEIIDHANHDTQDNRKANLRRTSHAGNVHNSRGHSNAKSKYKGVSPKGKRWRADYNGYYLGTFDTEEEAAYVYNQFARAVDPRFCYLNPLPHSFLIDLETSFRDAQPYYGHTFTIPASAYAYLQSFPAAKERAWQPA
jgi:hypothetical protein